MSPINANAGEYRSIIGLKDLYIAEVIQDDATGYVAGTPEYLAPAADISHEPSQSSMTQHADDISSDMMHAEGETKITMSITGLPAEMLAKITGRVFDAVSGRVFDNGGTPPYCALSFRSVKSNGSYRYYQYLKGRFETPKGEAAMKSASPDIKTTQLVFTAIYTMHKFYTGSMEEGVKRVFGDEDTANFSGVTWFSQVQVPQGIACLMGTALSVDTEELMPTLISHPGMVMTASSNLADDYFAQFTGWIRVISAPSLATLESKAAHLLSTGTPYEVLGYGLETGSGTPDEEWEDPVGSTEAARVIADNYGKLLMMAPGYNLMEDNEDLYDDMAALSDLWMFQTQQIQKDYPAGEDYRAECKRIIGLIQAGHSDISIWAQILMPPDEEPSALNWLSYGRCIMDMVEGEFIGAYLVWNYYDAEIILEEISKIFLLGANTPSALALSSSDPADNDTGVEVSKTITLTFNNALLTDGIYRVVVSKADGTIKACMNILDATRKIMTVNPGIDFDGSSTYVLSISVMDIYGQRLISVVNFTTA